MKIDTNRTEAFSDGVFAIALTLLVLDLHQPEQGRFASQLLDDWPAYLAYLTAFLTIAAVWINHHALFLRVRTVDAPTLVLNLGLLLGASLVPWPTALISASIHSGDRNDQTAATLVYAVMTVIVAIPWTTLNLHLARHPDLLDSAASSRWLRGNATLSAFSLALAAAAAGLALTAPLAALLLFLAAPLLLLVTNLRSTTSRNPR